MKTLTDLSFLDDLKADVKSSASLSEYTTFRLGGPCPFLVSCQSPEQLENVIKRFVSRKLDFILIGSGSNLLVSDDGIKKIIIRYETRSPLIRREQEDIIVSGSTLLDDLAQFAIREGLEGLTYTSGIPGTVGGAIVGNAGAFGKQVGDVLHGVTLMNKNGLKWDVSASALGFQYRHSDLKKTGDIVLAARFRLRPGDRQTMQKEREEILDIRHQKHPDLSTHPCAGSFYRNIEPTSQAGRRQAAGWFLEEAGAKALKVGGAAVFEKHANIIVKKEGCTAQNVYELSRLMAKAVKEKFDLVLVREVRLLGEFEGLESSSSEDFR